MRARFTTLVAIMLMGLGVPDADAEQEPPGVGRLKGIRKHVRVARHYLLH